MLNIYNYLELKIFNLYFYETISYISLLPDPE